MIKYVGVKTAEEAEQVHKKFVKEVNEYNQEIVNDRNRIWLIVTILAIAIAAAVYFFYYDAQFDLATSSNAFAWIVGIYLAINFLLIMSCSDAMRSDALWAHPASYRFFDATKNMTILKSEVRFNDHDGKRDLWLTLKNQNNEVLHECVRGFNAITKTDIKETIVDLDKETIFVPYKDWGIA